MSRRAATPRGWPGHVAGVEGPEVVSRGAQPVADDRLGVIRRTRRRSPRPSSEPPASMRAAIPRTSTSRGPLPGTMSSTTKATLGSLPMSRHFFEVPMPAPPIAIVSDSAS